MYEKVFTGTSDGHLPGSEDCTMQALLIISDLETIHPICRQALNPKQIMRHYFFFTAVLLSLATYAIAQQGPFVRVYNEAGKKTHKGYLLQTSDTSLIISLDNENIEVPVSQITTIKLKRSFGHTLAIATLIGAGSMAILGAATADPDAWIFGYTVAEGVAAGLIAGSASGAVVGAVIAGSKHRPVFKINGNLENWNTTRKVLQTYLPINTIAATP